jgi:hypothetical protein
MKDEIAAAYDLKISTVPYSNTLKRRISGCELIWSTSLLTRLAPKSLKLLPIEVEDELEEDELQDLCSLLHNFCWTQAKKYCSGDR